MLQVEEWEKGNHFVGVQIRNMLSNFRWKLLVVYGPADHTLSRGFLQEVREVCIKGSLPMVIAGDFNLVLEVSDKSTGHVDVELMGDFNKRVSELALMEIRRIGSKYTWTNKQTLPIFSNTDRVFATTEWENKHPLCSVYSILRVGSDHAPIIIDTGETMQQKVRKFFFEQRWLTQEGFKDGVI